LFEIAGEDMRSYRLDFEVAVPGLFKLLDAWNGDFAAGPPCFPFPTYFLLPVQRRRYLEVTAVDECFEPKFDCFTLRFEMIEGGSQDFETCGSLPRPRTISVLLREEWIKSPPSGEIQTIGQNPVSQIWGRPNSAPADAIAKCLVAAGVHVAGSDNLGAVIYAGSFPVRACLTADESEIREILAVHECVPLADYLARFG
jgi:hypothetical protein